jgi:hypothetical protein
MGAERRPILVIGARCGRLANRLILFANFAAFAEEHDWRLINFTFHSYAHLFDSTSRDVYCQYPPPSRTSWVDRLPGLAALIRQSRVFYHITRMTGVLNERWSLFGKRVLTFREAHGSRVSLEDPQFVARFEKSSLVFLFGWTFRAPNLIQKHAARLRDYFRIRSEHELVTRQAVERLRQQADLIVGVHLRHGDYRRWRGGKYYFPISQYHEWMRQMAKQFSGRRLAFLVCSDEPRQEREFPGVKVAFAPGVPVQDLYTLARCDYIFGPVSSFSQWASFYGNVPLWQVRNAEEQIEAARFRVSDLGEIPV